MPIDSQVVMHPSADDDERYWLVAQRGQGGVVEEVLERRWHGTSVDGRPEEHGIGRSDPANRVGDACVGLRRPVAR